MYPKEYFPNNIFILFSFWELFIITISSLLFSYISSIKLSKEFSPSLFSLNSYLFFLGCISSLAFRFSLISNSKITLILFFNLSSLIMIYVDLTKGCE